MVHLSALMIPCCRRIIKSLLTGKEEAEWTTSEWKFVLTFALRLLLVVLIIVDCGMKLTAVKGEKKCY
jgi:hypothetical protein